MTSSRIGRALRTITAARPARRSRKLRAATELYATSALTAAGLRRT